jgi:transcription initiation factor TFIID subunit TAF12
MKRLLISGFVAVALLAVVTTMRSYSISNDRSTVTTGVALSKKSPAAAGVTKLPIEEYEDMSRVFSAPTKP